MKVNAPGAAGAPAVRRAGRTRAKGKGKFADHIAEEESQAPAAVAGGSPLTPVDALLSVQEVPDSTTPRRRAAQRGFDMLDMLEQVRLGLLAGTIPRERLRALLRSVQNRDVPAGDPQLKALLEEIELRASVELAKLGELH